MRKNRFDGELGTVPYSYDRESGRVRVSEFTFHAHAPCLQLVPLSPEEAEKLRQTAPAAQPQAFAYPRRRPVMDE